MEHREGKEAQRVTVVALVDCDIYIYIVFFVSQNERREIGLVLQTVFLSSSKYVFDIPNTVASIFDLSSSYKYEHASSSSYLIECVCPLKTIDHWEKKKKRVSSDLDRQGTLP